MSITVPGYSEDYQMDHSTGLLRWLLCELHCWVTHGFNVQGYPEYYCAGLPRELPNVLQHRVAKRISTWITVFVYSADLQMDHCCVNKCAEYFSTSLSELQSWRISLIAWSIWLCIITGLCFLCPLTSSVATNALLCFTGRKLSSLSVIPNCVHRIVFVIYLTILSSLNLPNVLFVYMQVMFKM